MSKEPSPRAAALQAMREARYGHLQATVDPPPDQGISQWTKPKKPPVIVRPDRSKKPAAYAGKPKRKKRKELRP